jgi:dihydroorotate dehydrogenase (NAD+) catalytic subunit
MIELAPHHKYGLPIANPVMLAAGTLGYGEAVPPGLQPRQLGAVVVGPFLRHSRAGRETPRMAETNGGVVMDSGLQNRGVNAATKRFAPLWPDLGCPVIAQIGDSQPRLAAAVAERLAAQRDLLGVEVLLPRYASAQDASDLVRAVVRACDLPVLVKVPCESATQLAPAAVDAEAAALVVGTPPLGAAMARGTTLVGSVHGPLAFAPMLLSLQQVIALDLGCPVIACGGIHTLEQARQTLDAGAGAFQLESVVWVEPGIPALLAAQLSGE